MLDSRRHRRTAGGKVASAFLTVMFLLGPSVDGSVAEASNDSASVTSGSETGTGWATLRIVTEATELNLTVAATGIRNYNTKAVAVFHEDGRPVSGGGSTTHLVDTGVEAGARVNDDVVVVGSDLPREWRAKTYTMRAPIILPDGPTGPRVWHVLYFVAGEVTRWSWTIEGDAAIAVTGAEREQGGTYRVTSRERGFRGDAFAHVNLPHFLGAGVDRNSELELTVKDILVGAFIAQGGPDTVEHDRRLSMETPAGERECPCYFRSLSPEERLGAGRYTFRVDAVEAGRADYQLIAADVRLPD